MAHTQIYIFDTTLRDGEQSPGAAMEVSQKVEIALKLEHLGVDVIEAGFPFSSEQQYKGVKEIASQVKNSTVTALARALEKDIDVAADAVRSAQRPRIHTFLATSPIHREFKLKMTKEQVLQQIDRSVRYARSKIEEVEFSPEDAARTELDFLAEATSVAIDAGAQVVNIPDTVGYITPTEIKDIMEFLFKKVHNIDKAIISVHCHNDMGLALANTLTALKHGARQAEVTLNGIGERAGNTALEELACALHVRRDYWQMNCNIDLSKLYKTSLHLSKTIGYSISRNKPIIGENAFSHEAGIHQDGVLKNKQTYEILTPELVGRDETKLVLGRHSGTHGLRNRLAHLGIKVEESKFSEVNRHFKALADKKKEVYDEDLFMLVSDLVSDVPNILKLIDLTTSLSSSNTSQASVVLSQHEKQFTSEAEGDGPIDAIHKAICKAIHLDATLLNFDIHALTPGSEAMGDAKIVIKINDTEYTGRASSTDIIRASTESFISAINHYYILSYFTNK